MQQLPASTAVVQQAHPPPLVAESRVQARRRLHPVVRQHMERQPRRHSLALRQRSLRLPMRSWLHCWPVAVDLQMMTTKRTATLAVPTRTAPQVAAAPMQREAVGAQLVARSSLTHLYGCNWLAPAPAVAH